MFKKMILHLYNYIKCIIFSYILQLYQNAIDIETVENKSNELQLYVEKQNKKFEEFEKKTNKNVNIESLFYDVDEYTETFKHENSYVEKRWLRNMLYESTPLGNVCMVFDTYRRTFNYYSDVFIPRVVLDAVAKKYVEVYKCRDFYMDEGSAMSRIDYEPDAKKTNKMKELLASDLFVKPKTVAVKPKTEPNAIKYVPRINKKGAMRDVTFHQKKEVPKVVFNIKSQYSELFDEKKEQRVHKPTTVTTNVTTTTNATLDYKTYKEMERKRKMEANTTTNEVA